MARARTVIVKFRGARATEERRQRIRDLVGDDLVAAEPLFPDDEDPELAALYEVRLRRGADARRAVEDLLRDDEVAYAHEPGVRRGMS